MEDHVKKLLPIGSVVTLKEGQKKLMIYGVLQTMEEEGAKEYDYIAVPYPEGNVGPKHRYMFDHENIAAVHFRGFEDVERQYLMAKLSEYYKHRNEQ